MKKIVITALLLSIGIFALHIVSACGGFFCTNTPIDQTAERIIFTINGDDTISAIVGINYTGAAEDFSWVVPVPSVPELDVAPLESLNNLQSATTPRINYPTDYCDQVKWTITGAGGYGFLDEGNIGPYDYAIVSSTNPRELIDWLRDNGYQVTDAMEPIITEYVIEGMYFLAMKLSNDAEVGDIQPVKMTYKSNKPMIPLRLTAVAAVQNMPVLVWIFADEAYVPENYVHASVDYTNFRGVPRLQTARFNIRWDYGNEQRRIQDEFDGRAFITEYAMPSNDLLDNVNIDENDTFLLDLLNEFPFVTRLSAQLSPEQMTLDPTFIPDTSQNQVSRIIELDEYIDPLHYWGCSNREYDIESYERLLPEQTQLPNGAPLRYPEGWLQSRVIFNETEFDAFAPQIVTTEDIEHFFEGQSDFPILLRILTLPEEFRQQEVASIYSLDQYFGVGEEYELPEHLLLAVIPYDELFSGVDHPEGILLWLTTDEEWGNRPDTYRAVGQYLNTYAYYAHPHLRHTLALGSLVWRSYTIIGFPEGWTEAIDDYEIVTIIPDDGTPIEAKIQPLETQINAINIEDPDFLSQLIETYGFTSEGIKSIQENSNAFCHIFPIVPYEKDGQVGFLGFASGQIVTVSSSPEEFEIHQDTMFWIAESFQEGYGYDGCG